LRRWKSNAWLAQIRRRAPGVARGTQVARKLTGVTVDSSSLPTGGAFGASTGAAAWLDRQNKWAISVAASAFHGLLYLIPNHLQIAASHQLPLTAIDRWVPFIPQTAWIYWSNYGLVIVALLLCRDRGTTTQFVGAVFALVCTALVVHLAFPTAYPRALYPIGHEVDPITRAALERFRSIDTPASCLPSLHVGVCYLSAFASWGHASRLRFSVFGWATAVAISTLTLKQHYVLDLVAGIALAAVVWALLSRWHPLSETEVSQ
jgi:membrane-associated phospholipid phosphatase